MEGYKTLKAPIVVILNNGDRKDGSNYRVITLICTAMKMFEGISDKMI